MKYFAIMAAVTLCALTVHADEGVATADRLDAANAKLKRTVLALRASPAVAALEERATLARATRETAERSLPGMAQIEERITDARRQLKALYRERAALIRTHAAQLEALDKDVEEAEDARGAAVRDNPGVKALLAERKALTEQLEVEGSAGE